MATDTEDAERLARIHKYRAAADEGLDLAVTTYRSLLEELDDVSVFACMITELSNMVDPFHLLPPPIEAQVVVVIEMLAAGVSRLAHLPEG